MGTAHSHNPHNHSPRTLSSHPPTPHDHDLKPLASAHEEPREALLGAIAPNCRIERTSTQAAAEHGWQPFAFPPFATMRTNRSCSSIAPHLSLIPVAHVVNAVSNSALDPHFYYLAAGCSDTFLKPGETLVARNRYHALALLAQRRHRLGDSPSVRFGNVSQTVRWVHDRLKIPPGCGLSSLEKTQQLLSFNVCAAPFDSNAICLQSYSTMKGEPVKFIFQFMRELGIDTIVLAHEAPGVPAAGRLWKTELFRRLPFAQERFYDRHGSSCTVSMTPERCVFCRESVLSRAACVGPAPAELKS